MRLIPKHLDMAAAAIRVVLPLEYPADGILRRFFRDHHLLGVQERAFVAETVFGLLRHRLFSGANCRISYAACAAVGISGQISWH